MKRVWKNGHLHLNFTPPQRIFQKHWNDFCESGPFTRLGAVSALGCGTALAFYAGYRQGVDYQGMSKIRRKEAVFEGCAVGYGLGIFFGGLWPSMFFVVPAYVVYKTAEYTSRGKND